MSRPTFEDVVAHTHHNLTPRWVTALQSCLDVSDAKPEQYQHEIIQLFPADQSIILIRICRTTPNLSIYKGQYTFGLRQEQCGACFTCQADDDVRFTAGFKNQISYINYTSNGGIQVQHDTLGHIHVSYSFIDVQDPFLPSIAREERARSINHV